MIYFFIIYKIKRKWYFLINFVNFNIIYNIFIFFFIKIYRYLITNNINNPGNNWGSDKFYIIEVLDVFGKEAIGKLHRKYKPWAEIKVGHKLSIHK